ncbi:oxidoreductase, zinc-binding dehydrogenase family [Trichinella spiralis]|uniref:Enoyl-[acyl-carrier-protein] reductase, mitochondrial n=1 Tax=Trichinella spiralis TaxID=6334 RepID=E5S6T4_TRISP|nr:oxidoreductase, zinc-binding dehydrogenase family [Trichinella spiralis]KRY41102.1 Trans-2-enoyl-CoA reductase, mitochondrial [Trichinella spiralis]
MKIATKQVSKHHICCQQAIFMYTKMLFRWSSAGSFFVHKRSLQSLQMVYAEYGDPSKVLHERTEELKPLSKGEVRYKMLAASINPSDINQVQGVYPVKPPLPAVGGGDCVMKIEELGPEVKEFQVGDWAIPSHPGFGAWRTCGITTPDHLIKVNNKLPAQYAATLSVNPSTAYRMLKDYVKLGPGDAVLQNGANSAVGQLIIQLARHFGHKTVNIIRDKNDGGKTAEYLRSLGADHVVIDTQFKDESKRIFGQLGPPKLALNCVSGRSTLYLAGALAAGGKLVTYGGMSKQALQIPSGALIFKHIQVLGFWLTDWDQKPENRQQRIQMLDELSELALSGKLKMPLYESVPFKDFRRAMEESLTGTGKKKMLVFD